MQSTLSKNLSTKVQHRYLGRIAYEDAWRLQHALLEERIAGSIEDTILCLEHEHVITLGRKSPEYAAVESQGLKELAGVPLFVTERGGEATYHGPGQLVIYPICALSPRLGARGFLRFLEARTVELLAELDIASYWKEGATGVWLRNADGHEKKIASLGIAVRHDVSYHGLALNLSTDLSFFKKISPCGFSSSVMTSVQELLGKAPPVHEAGARLAALIEARAAEWR